jgi:hypothetical protein
MLIRTLAAAAIAAGLTIPTVDAATTAYGGPQVYALKTMGHMTMKHTHKLHCKKGWKMKHGKCYVAKGMKKTMAY